MPSADLPPPPAIQRVVLHDARAVRDCATLQRIDFAGNPAPRWALVILEPAPGSGAATVPGAAIQDGKLKLPPNAKTVVQKKGRWKRQGVLGDWPAEGAYEWTEPLDKPVRVVQPEDIYSPFASGGAILFRPEPGAAGLAQFGEVRLVFGAWAPLLPLAVDYLQKQNAAYGAAVDAEMLQRMARLENPILSLLALRELVTSQDLPAEGVVAHLNRTRGPLRACLAYVLLVTPKAASLGAELEAAVDRAATADTLLPFATGAFSVFQFNSTDPLVVARAKSLIVRVRQRAAQVGLPLSNDETLLAISRLAGIAP